MKVCLKMYFVMMVFILMVIAIYHLWDPFLLLMYPINFKKKYPPISKHQFSMRIIVWMKLVKDFLIRLTNFEFMVFTLGVP